MGIFKKGQKVVVDHDKLRVGYPSDKSYTVIDQWPDSDPNKVTRVKSGMLGKPMLLPTRILKKKK